MVALPTPKPTLKQPSAPESSDNPALLALQGFAPFNASLSRPLGVAYSGGADSTALLLAAHAYWPGQVQAVHIHHGLQAAADDFERLCASVCANLHIPLHCIRVQAQSKPGDSPEDAARRARYQALAAVAHQHDWAGVLLGQHADDQVETLLLALSRGAGLPGLAAMPEQFVRHGMTFYRPLLHIPAAELRAWLVQQGSAFIDDPSNTDQRYTRNRIRAQLLPALAAALPQFRATFARSARHAAQAQALLTEIAAQDALQVGMPPHITVLQQLSEARQANVLRYWLAQQHQAIPSSAQLHALQQQIKVCTTRGHQIDLKVAQGHVQRLGETLHYVPVV